LNDAAICLFPSHHLQKGGRKPQNKPQSHTSVVRFNSEKRVEWNRHIVHMCADDPFQSRWCQPDMQTHRTTFRRDIANHLVARCLLVVFLGQCNGKRLVKLHFKSRGHPLLLFPKEKTKKR
jgi:hypothetical protein